MRMQPASLERGCVASYERAAYDCLVGACAVHKAAFSVCSCMSTVPCLHPFGGAGAPRFRCSMLCLIHYACLYMKCLWRPPPFTWPKLPYLQLHLPTEAPAYIRLCFSSLRARTLNPAFWLRKLGHT
jgi:hypothetical protein